jgi:hypothetical protein
MHLLRDTGTVLLAVGGATLSTMALHCRWNYDTMRVAYTDKSPLCAISAVALLAGHPKDWSQQCFVGRLQVLVPREYVEALLPGIFAQQQLLQQQYQHAPNKASVDHSRISLVDTLVMLAEALLRVLPFRLQQHGGTYMLLQLPQVQAILASPTWPIFQQQVLDSHSKMEQQRQSPWATLAPHLAGRLDQLVDGMQHLTEAVNQQQSNVRPAAAQPVAAQQAAQQQAAQQQAAQPPPAAGPSAVELTLPQAAAAMAAAEHSPRSSRAQVVPALYSSRVKTVDDAFQVRLLASYCPAAWLPWHAAGLRPAGLLACWPCSHGLLALQPWPALLQADRAAVHADRGVSSSAWPPPALLAVALDWQLIDSSRSEGVVGCAVGGTDSTLLQLACGAGMRLHQLVACICAVVCRHFVGILQLSWYTYPCLASMA